MPRRFASFVLIPIFFFGLHACVHQRARKPVHQSKSVHSIDSLANSRALLGQEIEILESWIKEQNILYTQSSKGIWFGLLSSVESSIYIDSTSNTQLYINFLRLDGTPYYEPLKIEDPLNHQTLPKGIKHIITEIPVGVEAVIAMPSSKAYGALGDGQLIPANTPLVARIFITLGSQKIKP